MKMITKYIVLIMLLGCLCACGEKEQNVSQEAQRPTSEAQKSSGSETASVVPLAENKQSEKEIKVAPSKEEVSVKREEVLAGMPEDEIERLRENIKIANLTMERGYLNDDLFGKLSDPENLYWNYIDQKGEIQIGWAISDDIKFDSQAGMTFKEFQKQYGEPVMVYNRFDADNFVMLMQEMKDSIEDELLKADFDHLIENMKLARETHNVTYVEQIYFILHDMDYYLLRYGPEDVGKYTRDDSTIAKYYGVLEVYRHE